MKYLRHFINRVASWVYFKTTSEFTLRETANHTTIEELKRLRNKEHECHTIRPDEELASMRGSK